MTDRSLCAAQMALEKACNEHHLCEQIHGLSGREQSKCTESPEIASLMNLDRLVSAVLKIIAAEDVAGSSGKGDSFDHASLHTLHKPLS